MPTKILALAAALALASPWAEAQAVWRCGNSYSQQPCPGGRVLPSSGSPSPGEAAAASRAARTDEKLAADLERRRLAQERNAPKAIVIGPRTPASAPAAANKDGTRPKAGKLEQFTAVAPGTGDKRRKR